MLQAMWLHCLIILKYGSLFQKGSYFEFSIIAAYAICIIVLFIVTSCRFIRLVPGVLLVFSYNVNYTPDTELCHFGQCGVVVFG